MTEVSIDRRYDAVNVQPFLHTGGGHLVLWRIYAQHAGKVEFGGDVLECSARCVDIEGRDVLGGGRGVRCNGELIVDGNGSHIHQSFQDNSRACLTGDGVGIKSMVRDVFSLRVVL
jgi:hypothetical protein